MLASQRTAVALLAFVALVAVASAAPASAAERGYLGLTTGIAFAPNERFDDTDVFLDYDFGFRAFALNGGYGFANGVRAELEAAYRRNELEIIEFADARGQVNTGLHDDVETSSLMANVFYDFDLGMPLRPYLGVGVGWARVDYRVSEDDTDVTLLDDHDTAFAYQLMAGVGVPLGRRFHLSVDYRYWATSDLDLTMESGEPVSTDHPLHQASMTLRYGFVPRDPVRPVVGDGTSRWYTELRLGVVGPEDSDIDDGLPDTNFDGFDLGAATSLVVGRKWRAERTRGWRTELEVMRFRNHADIVDFGRLRGERRLRGPATALGVSANAIFDFKPRGAVQPFAGLGVGYAEVDYDIDLRDAGEESLYVDDQDASYTVQALLGLTTRLTPRLAGSFYYQYWWAPSIKLRDPVGTTWETEHSAHILMLALRYRLGN